MTFIANSAAEGDLYAEKMIQNIEEGMFASYRPYHFDQEWKLMPPAEQEKFLSQAAKSASLRQQVDSVFNITYARTDVTKGFEYIDDLFEQWEQAKEKYSSTRPSYTYHYLACDSSSWTYQLCSSIEPEKLAQYDEKAKEIAEAIVQFMPADIRNVYSVRLQDVTQETLFKISALNAWTVDYLAEIKYEVKNDRTLQIGLIFYDSANQESAYFSFEL